MIGGRGRLSLFNCPKADLMTTSFIDGFVLPLKTNESFSFFHSKTHQVLLQHQPHVGLLVNLVRVGPKNTNSRGYSSVVFGIWDFGLYQFK